MFEVTPLIKENPSGWKHPTLPVPEFRLLIIAPSHSGKSVLVSNLISAQNFPYAEYFGRNIFIVSPTFKFASMQGMNNIQPQNVFDSFDTSVLQGLLDDQAELIERYGKKKAVPFLLIFDDVAADLDKTQKAFLKKLFFGIRHLKGSVILISQQYRAVPKAVRMNATDTILFEITNSAELKDIAEEQAFPAQQFLDVLEYATTVAPYSFLTYRHKKKKEHRLQLRFENLYLN